MIITRFLLKIMVTKMFIYSPTSGIFIIYVNTVYMYSNIETMTTITDEFTEEAALLLMEVFYLTKID